MAGTFDEIYVKKEERGGKEYCQIVRCFA